MLKKIIIAFLLLCFAIPNITYAKDELNYTTLSVVDLNTFNEYRYKMTEKYFDLKAKYSINGRIDKTAVTDLLEIAVKGYNYLPDNLMNKNLLENLKISIARGINYPTNDANYTEIVDKLVDYIDNVNIKKVTGKIDAFPSKGNAPLTVTFRAKVNDPSGTTIPNYNYIWWMDVGGKRKILSQSSGPSLNYTFTEEGNFSVFLDVVSKHKNIKGNIDVLPFRSRENIEIEEKIASIILKVNKLTLRNKRELKFTPEEASYGLVFDATSSTPTGGSKFTSTQWDFGNKVTRKYNGDPKVERVVYSKEGEYTVTLKLRTNEGKSVKREFVVVIHDPIATIKSNMDEGFLGDKFTFSSDSGINEDDLTYAWEIIDIKNDKIIFRKTGKLFTYSFAKKGQFNIKLKVTEPSSNIPDVDTKIIYINSQAPVVDFDTKVPYSNKPNTILFDATKTYDPDYSDEGKLIFSRIIDGNRIELENPNYNGSIGYYTFDSIGDHSIVLEVTDLDGITIQKKEKVNVKSILSVDFGIFPRVANREQTIRFVANSKEARVFDWDFGDGDTNGGKDSKAQHKYSKSGVFKVKLKVIDKNDNFNTFSKDVYIGESDFPYSFISVTNSTNNELSYEKGLCNGNGAYVIDRVNSVKFSGDESINIDGTTKNLRYTWKLENSKYIYTKTFDKKFDELGCFPVTLSVKSDDNGKSDSKTIWVKVKNIEPELSSINFDIVDESSDPVVVNLSAVGAKDRDGVIQNYLWYYYTDIDSEPQDFRSTRSPNTTFVLPKVTGNYYFVVVMKDNNEARINSDDITGSKYFITLTGDNLNVPIIKLNVDKTSISIGDEIVFSADVENILGQNISKKAKYSWDFDGDGFYDKETTSPTLTHIFKNSGEFHVKVKTKYKGFSNTKSITVGVANILKPDFNYISIGNKFIFLDNSIGSYSSIEWDLGDGTIIKDKKTFEHIYTDKLPSHLVEIKLKEGSKIKTHSLKVLKNAKNIIKAKKTGLIYFSNIEIKNDELTFDQEKKLYIYLKESNENQVYYGIDYDINYDSDLNGGKDDDIDNINDDTYKTGNPILVELNNQKEQKVRLSLFDTDGKIIESYDFIINKSYIEEKSIDIDTINFTGVTNSEKLKIEKLKSYISNISKEHKLKSMMYVQKLQEEWFDQREKTNVILEFENYILETGVKDSEEIINILESLLVEGQEDKSEKSIIYNALKKLIPVGIKCDSKTQETLGDKTCYQFLIEKLDTINDNQNIEENKILGTQILKIIEIDINMTNKEKIDFKAILKTFIYGGLENIPEQEIEKEVVIDNTEDNVLFGLIYKILIGIAGLIGVFGVFILLFYIWYKIVNKDSNVGFQDFIIERTSGNKNKKVVDDDDELDILSEIGDVDKEETISKVQNISKIPKKVEKVKENKDIFNFDNIDVNENKKKQLNKKNVIDKNLTSGSDLQKINNKDVPSWLKGSFGEEENKEMKKESIDKIQINKETKVTKDPIASKLFKTQETKTQEIKKEDTKKEEIKKREIKKEEAKIKEVKQKDKKEEANIPDWLKGSIEEGEKEKFVKISKKTDTKKIEKSENVEKDISSKQGLDELTKIDDIGETKNDKNIPDWLKGSFDTDESIDNKTIEKTTIKTAKENKDNIPDWLKGSFEEDKQEEEKKVVKQNVKKPITKKESDGNKQKNISIKNDQESKKEVKEIKKTSNKDTIKTKDTNKQTTSKQLPKDTNIKSTYKKDIDKKDEKSGKPKSDSDLWDDGMKIPDWLKTDSDK